MANRDRDRDNYQTAGDDYSSGQSQLIRDDFSSQGSNQYQRSGKDSSSDFTQNQSNQGSNQYQADMDILSDSIQSSAYTNQGSRGGAGDRSFGSSPKCGSENPGSGPNWTGVDSISDSSRGSSDNRGLNQYQAAMDRLTDLTQNSGGYDIKGQATNFLQQTGEQVKNMAQGAADAVKSTLGMNTSDHNATSQVSSIHTSKDSSYQSNSPSKRV